MVSSLSVAPQCEYSVFNASLYWEGNEPVLKFRLMVRGTTVEAFEAVTNDGELIEPSKSKIIGPFGRLDDGLAERVRATLEKICFYDLQAINCDFYYSDPDG